MLPTGVCSLYVCVFVKGIVKCMCVFVNYMAKCLEPVTNMANCLVKEQILHANR